MTAIKWDELGERFFRTGVSRGVLQVEGDTVAVPWNGLTSVSEEVSGGEHQPQYFEGAKTLDHVETEDTALTLECVMYPKEFERCDGFDQIYTHQLRKRFNLAYRNQIGNDVEREDLGYDLHLIYNATALPTKKTYDSIEANVPLSVFSWSIHAVPEFIDGMRPTAHLIISSIDYPEVVAAIEDILYGTDDTDPVFMDMGTVVDIFDPPPDPTVTVVELPAQNITTTDAGVGAVITGGPTALATRSLDSYVTFTRSAVNIEPGIRVGYEDDNDQTVGFGYLDLPEDAVVNSVRLISEGYISDGSQAVDGPEFTGDIGSVPGVTNSPMPSKAPLLLIQHDGDPWTSGGGYHISTFPDDVVGAAECASEITHLIAGEDYVIAGIGSPDTGIGGLCPRVFIPQYPWPAVDQEIVLTYLAIEVTYTQP